MMAVRLAAVTATPFMAGARRCAFLVDRAAGRPIGPPSGDIAVPSR